jgi:glycine hydroxymethyltransferase
MTEKDMPVLAVLIARGLRGNEPAETVAADVTAFRRNFTRLHFVNQ